MDQQCGMVRCSLLSLNIHLYLVCLPNMRKILIFVDCGLTAHFEALDVSQLNLPTPFKEQ